MSELDRREQMQRELFLSVLMPTKPPVAMARKMARSMHEVRAPQGHVLYEKGDVADSSFFITQGTVVLDDDGADPLTFTVGDIVGVVDLNMDRPRSRRAQATTDVVLLQLAYEVWIEAQEDNVEWTAATGRVVSEMVHKSMLESAAGLEHRHQEPLDPVPTKFEDTLLARIVLLHGSNFFERAGVQALAALAERAQGVSFEPGQIVPTHPDSIYLVAEGAVVLERHTAPLLRLSFGRGELLLAGGAFSGSLDQYEARGAGNGTLLVLRWADLEDVIEDHFQLARSLMRGISLSREHWMDVRRGRRGSLPAPPIFVVDE